MNNNETHTRRRNQTTWPRTTYKVFCAVGIFIGILLLIRLYRIRSTKKGIGMDENEATQSKNSFTKRPTKHTILLKLEKTEIDLFLNSLDKFFEVPNFKKKKDFNLKNFDLLIGLNFKSNKKQFQRRLENSATYHDFETYFNAITVIEHSTRLKSLKENLQHEEGSFLSINISSLPLNPVRLLNSFQESDLQSKHIFSPSQSPCKIIQHSNEKKQNSNPIQDQNNTENFLILSDCKIYKLSKI
ncbi:hypothetical protein M0813_05535 [Anaeramoeba flamelloides]|uniref:Transmembrane protein n=1 Tax=Anaeramoeba flamelloides TaxID=1746091 RepID=A0ABQ8XH39_9EUKA|nr:hypothetical protein M0813_05535 [Anaeramoeba flamelloides]